MELVIKKLNPEALQIGGVYRVVGKPSGISINCLAVCIKADDNCGEYVIIKDYEHPKCYGDKFKIDLVNYSVFSTFHKFEPTELRIYPTLRPKINGGVSP